MLTTVWVRAISPDAVSLLSSHAHTVTVWAVSQLSGVKSKFLEVTIALSPVASHFAESSVTLVPPLRELSSDTTTRVLAPSPDGRRVGLAGAPSAGGLGHVTRPSA